jgi:hypothetical protein
VKTTLSSAPSDPTHSIFFQSGAPGCEECATFHGDYIAVAYGSDGRSNSVWTDMSEYRPADHGYAQSIYFKRK